MPLIMVANFLKAQQARLNAKSENEGRGSPMKVKPGRSSEVEPTEAKEEGTPSVEISYHPAQENDNQQVNLVRYILPDVKPDGHWGVVISHGDSGQVNDSMRGEAPLMLQIIPQFSPTPEEASTETVTESEGQAQASMEIGSSSSDSDESISNPNEDDEAHPPSKDGGPMLMTTWRMINPAITKSSPNCFAEIYPNPMRSPRGRGQPMGKNEVFRKLKMFKKRNGVVPPYAVRQGKNGVTTAPILNTANEAHPNTRAQTRKLKEGDRKRPGYQGKRSLKKKK